LTLSPFPFFLPVSFPCLHHCFLFNVFLFILSPFSHSLQSPTLVIFVHPPGSPMFLPPTLKSPSLPHFIYTFPSALIPLFFFPNFFYNAFKFRVPFFFVFFPFSPPSLPFPPHYRFSPVHPTPLSGPFALIASFSPTFRNPPPILMPPLFYCLFSTPGTF